ncbi:MAG: hypothetical protein JW940_09460 [Polyangiaceae bacterium]|nr:hypothetical protein [Polyangiaceae bacterium]
MRVAAVVQGSLVLAALVVTAWAALRAPAPTPSGPVAPEGAALGARRQTVVPRRGPESDPAVRPASTLSGQPSEPLAPVGSRFDALPPDLSQNDPELALPGGGAAYCGPVSVSNWLTWLSSQGYERLVPEAGTPKRRQVALVRTLATLKYMGTSPFGGTGPVGLLRGLSRWIAHAGYRVARLEYQGWRQHPRKFATGVSHPKLSWLTDALEAGGAAWLHVGWYHKSRYQLGFRRRGGHWLTLVGVEQHSGEAPVITVRDPAPYAGEAPTLERVTLRELDKGTLVDVPAALPAKGYYQLVSGIHLKRPDDIPVIDGAVILVLEPAP